MNRAIRRHVVEWAERNDVPEEREVLAAARWARRPRPASRKMGTNTTQLHQVGPTRPDTSQPDAGNPRRGRSLSSPLTLFGLTGTTANPEGRPKEGIQRSASGSCGKEGAADDSRSAIPDPRARAPRPTVAGLTDGSWQPLGRLRHRLASPLRAIATAFEQRLVAFEPGTTPPRARSTGAIPRPT